MKNLLAALACSLLLHAAVLTLLYLSEPVSGANAGLRTLGKRSGPPRISLRLAAPEVERSAIPAPDAGDHTEGKEDLPQTSPLAGSEESTGTASAAESASQFSPSEGAYYPSGLLTLRPAPLNDINLDAPEILFLANSGKVILMLRISETGEVVDVSVETVDIPEQVASGIVSAFKQLRFKPGELNEQKVGALMKIEVGVEGP